MGEIKDGKGRIERLKRLHLRETTSNENQRITALKSAPSLINAGVSCCRVEA